MHKPSAALTTALAQLSAGIAAIHIPHPAQAQTYAIASPGIVQACLSAPACIVSTAVLSGATYLVFRLNGQTWRIETPGWTEDPDAPASEVWEDRIWADSFQDAQRKCRLYAAQNQVVYVGVRHVGRGKAYICRVRSYQV